ncbi:MAG: MaoC/PaaZ C-terminal domain-containing protein [Proteobacteria bacterium]|nr:MaoC/PaaZ C-terminal domain-containing protein [Pseudomonadota bacterium]
MTVAGLADIEFGADLPAFTPDTSLAMGSQFATLIGWAGPRFSDHEGARKEGLPGAMIPGVMSQGFLVAMIHHWAPTARIVAIDTVFRAPVMADDDHTISGVVTDIDEAASTVEIDLTVANAKQETRVFGTATIAFD